MNTRNILWLTALTLSLGMLTACSNDNEQQADGRVPISLSAVPLTVEETRTAASPELNQDYLEPGQTVKVRVRNTGSTGSWANYIFDAGNNGVMTASGIPPFYPMDDTHVDIVAYCPAAAGTSFSVHSDQTSPESYLASDLLFASVSNQAKTNTTVPMQFEHKLAKVVVSATAGAGVSTIEEITLHKVLPEVTFNQETGNVGAALGTATSIVIVKGNTTAAATGVAVIPAQAIDGELVTIKTNLGTATYAVSSKVFSSGKVYNLNITVNRAAVGATTQIVGWTDTASASVNKEEASKVFTLVDENGGHRSFTMIRVEGGPYTTLAGQDVTGTLSSFYIGQLEVTNFLWWMIMRTLPAGTKELPYVDASNTYPVELVCWNDIVDFLAQLNEKLADQLDGMHFKLPTEAQWEYAARGGINQERYTYSGGDRLDWYAVDYTYAQGKPRPCGDRYANSLGIYDMSGNVWEFCSDNYRVATTLPTDLGLDYTGPSTGNGHVLRGGGFKNNGTTLANNYENTAQVNYLSIVGSRWPYNNTEKDQHVGLRLVLQ